MKTILLNPGPVTLSDRVRGALLGPDLCHREPEFSDLQARIREKLLAVYDLGGEHWAAVLLTGSGTAAVEAMIASCVPAEGALVVAENGVYGERMSAIAAAHRIPVERVAAPWGAEIELSEIERVLAREERVSHLAIVQHETTTGRLNRLEPVAALAARYGVRLLLDGVSSFGAEEIRFEEWRLDACAATANKCLHGVPGTAFVLVRRDACARAPEPPRSVYLNLAEYLAKQDALGTPFTQSVQTFYALEEALSEFLDAGGVSARRALFRERMARIRRVLEASGVRPLLGAGETSCVLHAFELPEGNSYRALHDALKRQGFIIYAGQGALSERVFRVSAMGDIDDAALDRLEACLQAALPPGGKAVRR